MGVAALRAKPEPICRAPGCGATLESAYARRVRLCLFCMRLPALQLGDGEPVRFCSRCHTCHPLSAFHGNVHGCSAKLQLIRSQRSEARAARDSTPRPVGDEGLKGEDSAPGSASANPEDKTAELHSLRAAVLTRTASEPSTLIACRVPGCGAPLESAYARRVHLCAACMRLPTLQLGDGEPVRFCSRCHTCHPLSAFHGDGHGCSAKLQLVRTQRSSRAAREAAAEGGSRAGAEERGAAKAPRAEAGGAHGSDGPAYLQSSEFWPSEAALTFPADDVWASELARMFLPPTPTPAHDPYHGLGPPGEMITMHVKLPLAEPSMLADLPLPPEMAGALMAPFPAGSQLIGASLRAGCLILSADALMTGSCPADAGREAARDSACADAVAQTLRKSLAGRPAAQGCVGLPLPPVRNISFARAARDCTSTTPPWAFWRRSPPRPCRGRLLRGWQWRRRRRPSPARRSRCRCWSRWTRRCACTCAWRAAPARCAP